MDISPGTAKLDRGPKPDLYAASGVQELWLVEPRQQQIEIYLLQDELLTLVRTAVPGDTIETPLIASLIFAP
ncbi:MAG: Uma2 family endonuclease [Opitutaceae bacterium]